MAYPDVATNFRYRSQPDIMGVGLLLFAGSMVGLLGLLNLFYEISVLAGSHIFITHAAWLIGHATPAGWIILIVALIQLSAPVSIWLGGRYGQVVGILSAVSNIAAQVAFFSDVPAVAVIIILIDIGVIHALLAYGGGGGLRPLVYR
jgi:hypothetical protein